MPKESKELTDKIVFIELRHKSDVEKHEMKMLELKYIRDTDRIRHDNEMERQRIKSAEIRKAQMRRGDGFKY